MFKIAGRLGMAMHSLYAWKMKYGPNAAKREDKTPTGQQVRRLGKELKWITEERDPQTGTCTLQVTKDSNYG